MKLQEVTKAGVPPKTKQSTAWAMNVWDVWAQARNNMAYVEETEKSYLLHRNFIEMSVECISFWRKQENQVGTTIHQSH